jgi:hypothetical protein
MADPADPPLPLAAKPAPLTAKHDREVRLAAALRANLRRRKAADRAPRAPPDPGET